MLKQPISRGTFILFLFVSIIPIVLVALLILHHAKSEQNNIVKSRLENSADHAAILVEDYLHKDVFKKTREFADYYKTITFNSFSDDEIQLLVEQWLKGNALNAIFLINGKHDLSALHYPEADSLSNPSFQDELSRFVTELNLTDPSPKAYYFVNHEIFSVFYAVPVQLKHDEPAYIISFVRMSDLPAKLSEIFTSKASALVLMDSTGKLIWSHWNHARTRVAQDSIKIAVQKFVKHQRTRITGTSSIIELDLGAQNTCLALFRDIPDTRKIVAVLGPAITYQSVLRHVYIELVIALLLALFLAAISNYYAYTRIGIPIKRLTDAADRVSKGFFDVKVENTHMDEIGNLTRVFNQTIAQVRTFNQINIDKIIIERKKLEHIVEQMIEGILIVDPENNILMVNKSFADWYGLNKKDIIDQKLSSLPNLVEYYEMVKTINWERRTDFHRKKIINSSTDEKIPKVLQATATNIFTSGKTFLATSVYIRDITKEHEVDKLKSELISIVAHELRSPMVSIIGFSEMLMESDLDPETRVEYLEIIHQESTRLSEFIDQFLDLTRIESGSLPLNCKDENFTRSIQKVVKLYSSQAIKKRIALETDFSDPMQVVCFDSVLIERAVGNLLSNAIKYCDDNAEIRIRTYKEDQRLGLEVADTGPGISDTDLQHIFEKFYRVEQNSSTSTVKGSGLGLAFVKQVVEKHDGEVYAYSTLNQGSVFGMLLPLRSVSQSKS